MDFTQKEIAFKINISEQAVSKWENGECLSDVYNLILLGQIFRVSVNTLLDTKNDRPEKIIETIKVNGAEFDIIEKSEIILAGKIIYAKDFIDLNGFNTAIEAVSQEDKRANSNLLEQNVLPIIDIHLSVSFGLDGKSCAFGFKK